MKTSDLIAVIARKMSMPADEAAVMFDAAISRIRSTLCDGKSVNLQGFGVLEVKRKEERLSVHPATKERTLIPPKQIVAFKQSSSFKVKINEVPGNE
jgi:DNA-binding protein HU-beta